ncbi:MAG: Gfo/Idh/MocA family oxidoreductase [Planctomycetes bacterium]|nr:Gfo/Idh/MocA family oxidoreductase [Planctomycetota bacterium]
MTRIRFAIIGCGRMGRHHGQKLIDDGRGEIAALLDAQRPMAAGLQQELCPTARICDTLEQLVSLDNIEAAIICTPTAEHHRQALACLDRGWHVLCEKPLAAHRAEILELIARSELAVARRQAFSLGYQRRHTSLYRTIRREVRSGRWGSVRAIVSHNVENWQPTITGTWRDDPRQNTGGFVTDAGSHKIDLLFYITGLTPQEVFARSQTWGSHVEIVTSVSALFSGDVTATIDFIGHAQYLGEDLSIHCERADLMIRHGEFWIAREGQMERQAVDEPESTPVNSFLDTILQGTAELSPPSAALPVFDLTWAILESGRRKQPVCVSSS